MIRAYELLETVRDIASDREDLDQVELIAQCHELIQAGCYPNTLIPKVPLVSAIPMSYLITYTQEDYDGYSIYNYYYKFTKSKDPAKTDRDKWFDFGFQYTLRDTFTIRQLSDEDKEYISELINSTDGCWLEETNDLIGYSTIKGGTPKTVNGIDFGFDSKYEDYNVFTVVIVYGDKKLDFLTPKESVFK